jgi:thiosulfate/3-mercaptopyruvate sulfurtransferase
MFSTLITTEELAGRLGSPGWVVVDCRFDLTDPAAGEAAWREAHIPGAVFADLDRLLSGPVSPERGGRHPLPDAETLCAGFGQLGIHAGSQVIAYDASAGMLAGRLWWLLRWLGHEQVAVLDGGLDAWLQAGHEVNSIEPEPAPCEFHGEAGHMPVLNAEQVAAGIADGSLVVVDVRAADRFRGETEPLDKVAGHVPGAINLPLGSNLSADGTFHTAEVLAALYEKNLPDTDPSALAFMCGSGVSACHSLLALEIIGWSGAALYAGSWSDWISDPHRPVASGTT